MSKAEKNDGEFIISYKGLDKNFQCRGYQYEVGKEYTHAGPVIACNSGFHSCENPLDVLDYYPLSTDTRFAVVKAGGTISRDGNKIASASLAIEAELKFPQFVVAAVDFIKAACNFEKKPADTASGYSSQLAASGNYSKLAASGKNSIAAAVSAECIAKAADGGCIVLRWTDNNGRPRVCVGYVGEDEIKAGIWYEVKNGALSECANQDVS